MSLSTMYAAISPCCTMWKPTAQLLCQVAAQDLPWENVPRHLARLPDFLQDQEAGSVLPMLAH